MSEQFTVTIDKADVERRLGDLKAKAPQVIAKSLNWTAKSARTRLANKAKEVYTVKSVGFADSMKIKNATPGNLDAILRSQGEPLQMKRFSYRASRGDGVSAMIVKGSGYKSLNKGGIKAYKSSRGNIKQRLGAERYPVKSFFSNSIPVMLGSEKRVYGIVEPYIKADQQKNLSQAIAKLVG